jgi:hypothetical protein
MLKKVRHQLPALAALVDFWWAGVDQDLAQAGYPPKPGQVVVDLVL